MTLRIEDIILFWILGEASLACLIIYAFARFLFRIFKTPLKGQGRVGMFDFIHPIDLWRALR